MQPRAPSRLAASQSSGPDCGGSARLLPARLRAAGASEAAKEEPLGLGVLHPPSDPCNGPATRAWSANGLLGARISAAFIESIGSDYYLGAVGLAVIVFGLGRCNFKENLAECNPEALTKIQGREQRR